MKILQINSGNFGSTGNIMLDIANLCSINDIDVKVAYPDSRTNRKKKIDYAVSTGSILDHNLHRLVANFTGKNGCYSYFSTRKFLREVDKFNPDIIHLHNLHNFYLNLPLLFSYIKKHQISVVWTLHDCWAFTGQCPHFIMAKCDKWKSGCYKCPQYRKYPESYVDRTKLMWKKKKDWFTGIEDVTLVCPSQWLGKLAAQSYLKNYDIKVIYNGLDLSIFHPQESNFREKYGLKNKKIVLGVAFDWGERKGLDIMIRLAQNLDDSFCVVMVGTNDSIDKMLPPGIVSIHRTHSQQEMAEIYSAADVFVNPTREEVLGLVNLEALACGTPVVIFDTGGSPECVDENSGIVVPVDDVEAMIAGIQDFCSRPQEEVYRACIQRSKAFEKEHKYLEYLNLYREIYQRGKL